jgi:antitoxin component of MazEF toxin-antitoxin module
MKTPIKKFGAGLASRTPKPFVRLAEDSTVDVTVFSRVERETELFARITPENCHSETDTGTPVGNEVW